MFSVNKHKSFSISIVSNDLDHVLDAVLDWDVEILEI